MTMATNLPAFNPRSCAAARIRSAKCPPMHKTAAWATLSFDHEWIMSEISIKSYPRPQKIDQDPAIFPFFNSLCLDLYLVALDSAFTRLPHWPRPAFLL